jgi:hypothetical protein
MGLPIRLYHLPTRVATGAFILNSGLGKLSADNETAAGLYGMAKGAYPFLDSIEPTAFAKLLAAGEITLGTALLLPFVPTAVAGAGLTMFSAGLVGLYLRTPGMTVDGIRPSEQGLPLAKDVWMLSIGVSFLLEGAADRRARARAAKRSAKAAKNVRAAVAA